MEALSLLSKYGPEVGKAPRQEPALISSLTPRPLCPRCVENGRLIVNIANCRQGVMDVEGEGGRKVLEGSEVVQLRTEAA